MRSTLALLAVTMMLLLACGCDSSDADATPDAGPVSTPGSFLLFDHLPQFGIYVYADPDYTPPPGVTMWTFGTEYVAKLTPEQQAMIGADLAARVTYHAQCDNYDRLGGLFFVVEPRGQVPAATDARTELVRFITPFSDHQQGALATHVYPDADLAAQAAVLADPTHDVWIGIAGGSNPYDGDPCTGAPVTASFASVGFAYSVELVSTKPLVAGSAVSLRGASLPMATTLPVDGVFENPAGPLTGHITVIVSGHGSAAGGDEYRFTQDTLSLNGAVVGSFSTMVDCAPYRQASPDGNPGIFQGNLGGNPRNWCPGAIVAAHSFPVTLPTGRSVVSLAVDPSSVPDGSYYSTSIQFSAP